MIAILCTFLSVMILSLSYIFFSINARDLHYMHRLQFGTIISVMIIQILRSRTTIIV